MKREVVLSSKWQETGEKKERRSKKRWEHPRKGTELGVKAPPPPPPPLAIKKNIFLVK